MGGWSGQEAYLRGQTLEFDLIFPFEVKGVKIFFQVNAISEEGELCIFSYKCLKNMCSMK